MTEIEKLQYTKDFIDKLANGINPLDDTQIPEGDLLNHVRLSRCMFYVSGILQRVIEYEELHEAKNARKKRREAGRNKCAFMIAPEQLEKFEFGTYPISLTEFSARLYTLANNQDMEKLTYSRFSRWLLYIGMIYETIDSNDKRRKHPTEEGKKIGISSQTRIGKGGNEYEVTLFNREAQQFLLDNLEAVIAFSK